MRVARPTSTRFAGAPRRDVPAVVRLRGGRGAYDEPVGLQASSLPLTTSFADDVALIAGLRNRDARARVALVDRYGPYIERLVAGALGVDGELADAVNDVFVGVFERIHQLRDPAALRGWIGSLAVFTARGYIRKRRRWRWIRFFAPEDIPETAAPTATPEQYQTVRATYQVLEKLPEDERVAFALRFVSEMELTEVAAACKVSLATIKRRLARAETRFREEALKNPTLSERMERGRRWKNP
jgi:RNA polymerase sigma-70 factor, ECF subfamily